MFSDNMIIASSLITGYSILNSLLFRGGQSLSRVRGTPTNAQKATISVWVRRAALGTVQDIIGSSGGAVLRFGTSTSGTVGGTGTDQITVCGNSSGAYVCTTSAVFRDPNAWMHIHVTWDSTASAGSRIKLWVNGVLQSWASYAEPTSGAAFQSFAAGATLYLGSYDGANNFLNGEVAEAIVVDGAALSPTAFGEIDSVTTNWRPKGINGVTWGANGSYLGRPWNAASLGTDYSGNGNNWTPSGFSASDVLSDSPTNMYATLNPIDPLNVGGTVLTEGNLKISGTGTSLNFRTSVLRVKGGKWSVATTPAIIANRMALGLTADGTQRSYLWNFYDLLYYANDVSSAYGARPSAGQEVRMDFDLDAGSIEWFVNGVSQGQKTGIDTSRTYSVVTETPGSGAGGSTPQTQTVNFGQRSFAHTPPTSFKSLCSANLTAPTSAAARAPWKYYSCQLVSHNGTSTNFTVGWNPDPANGGSHTLWRVKGLAAGSSWNWIDTVRGIDKVLFSDTIGAELIGQTQRLASANASGVCSLGSSFGAGTYLVEAWRVAPEAGFDIVTWLGTGGTRSIAHDNGTVPGYVVVRNRGTGASSGNWGVKHRSQSSNYNLYLNSTSAEFNVVSGTLSGGIGDLNSATTFSIVAGTSNADNFNQSGQNFVAWVWSPVPGFSAFDKHTGNGSADGSFDWLGFVPGAYTTKNTTTSGGSWLHLSTAVSPSNPSSQFLFLNLSSAAGGDGNSFDLLASGVKCRGSSVNYNSSGDAFVYAAWAKAPLGASTVTPATAR